MTKLSQYRVFVTAFEMGGVSAAADQLNISPSAVSKQLSALENHLNVTLFERSNRNIKPTEHGVAFYPKCKMILNEILEAEESLTKNKSSVAGIIRVTLSKSLLRSGLIEKFSAFSDRYSEVRFSLHFSEDVEDLHESDFDFAFRLGQIEKQSSLIAISLQHVTPIFCATPKYLKKFGSPKNYPDLANHRLCHFPLAQLSQSVPDFLKAQRLDFSTSHHHYADDIEAIYQMVSSDMCIGMMLDCSVAKEIYNGDLIEVLQDKRPPSKKLHLLFRKSHSNSHRNLKFKEFIKNAYK